MYLERKPSPPLSSYIETYWVMAHASSGETFSHTVVPDRCTDLIFDLGETPFLGFRGEGAKVVGVMTKAMRSFVSPQNLLLGVRFKPYGASRVFRFSVSEIVDQKVALKDLHADDFDVREMLFKAKGLSEKFEILDDFFMRKLPGFRPVHMQTERAVGLIEAAKGSISISALVEAIGVSRRHLSRCFLDNIGLAPKEFLQITRFRSSLAEINASQEKPDWIDLALRHGFYDQAHLINDFKAVMNVSPNQYWQALRTERSNQCSLQ